MAYPFAQAPTLREFIGKLEQFGVHVCSVDGLSGPRGAVTIRFLERGRNGNALRSEPLPESDDMRVGVDLARRLCRQLKLDPRELDIGFDLG